MSTSILVCIIVTRISFCGQNRITCPAIIWWNNWLNKYFFNVAQRLFLMILWFIFQEKRHRRCAGESCFSHSRLWNLLDLLIHARWLCANIQAVDMFHDILGGHSCSVSALLMDSVDDLLIFNDGRYTKQESFLKLIMLWLPQEDED